MATYTTDGRVTKILPSSLPTGFSEIADRAPYIADASAWVDGELVATVGQRTYGSATQCFPDVSSSPATPAIIQRICALAAARFIATDMKMHVNFGGPDGSEWWEEAKELIQRITDGNLALVDSAGTAIEESSIRTNVENSVPRFSIGRYDADGEQVSAEEGTLDGI